MDVENSVYQRATAWQRRRPKEAVMGVVPSRSIWDAKEQS
jgi:hypothetical protein